MEYQDKVRWLKSYKDKYYRLIEIQKKMINVNSPSFEEMTGGGIPKTINDYIDEKAKLLTEMGKIKMAIMNVPEEKDRYVLIYRFIEFNSLEDVAEIMHYSLPSIKKYYKSGVNSIPKYT